MSKTKAPDEAPQDRTIVNDTSRVLFIYDEAQNPDGRFIDGVPLRTLTADDCATYPDWLLATITAASWYIAQE